MSKCDWYVVSVRKTICGAGKIRKGKVPAQPCCSYCCVGDLLVKALPYITIAIIGCVVSCRLTHLPGPEVHKEILEVRNGTNVAFSVTHEVKWNER